MTYVFPRDFQLSILMPIHNEAAIIEETLGDWKNELKKAELCHVRTILIENGSRDHSVEKILALEESQAYQQEIDLRCLVSSERGMGFAYDMGLRALLENSQSRPNNWVMLTVADLPFGFSDFESFLNALKASPESPVFIGSKAHAQSKVSMGLKRKIANVIFRSLRRIFLGIKTKDTQGVFFLREDAVRAVYESIKSRNFFYTTELVFLLEKKGFQIQEVPVIYQGERRKSSVRIFSDGWGVIKEMFQLLARSAK